MTKFIWIRDTDNIRTLRAQGKAGMSADYSNPGLNTFITEQDMVSVAEWCQQNRCGRRVSFDRFKFRREEEITMFLLRWS